MDAEVFWKKVKMKLAELGKNQEWLCSKTGILIGSLRNKIHLGRLPSLEEGIKIIDAFGMTMEEFRAYPELPAKDIIINTTTKIKNPIPMQPRKENPFLSFFSVSSTFGVDFTSSLFSTSSVINSEELQPQSGQKLGAVSIILRPHLGHV